MEIIAIESEAFKELQERLKTIEEKISSIDPKNSKNPEYLDTSEVLIMLGISARTLQAWRDQGRLGFTKISRKIYFRASEIKEILDNNYKPRRD